MQYAKCIKSNVRGSLAEKCLRNEFRYTAPISCYVFHFFTDFFNVILLYFLQAETPPADQKKTFDESFNKARRRRHF